MTNHRQLLDDAGFDPDTGRWRGQDPPALTDCRIEIELTEEAEHVSFALTAKDHNNIRLPVGLPTRSVHVNDLEHAINDCRQLLEGPSWLHEPPPTPEG